MKYGFKDFLDRKPLYYQEIDHQRVHDAYAILQPHIQKPKTIHLVGTNGKGSTGRIFSHLAFKAGFSVGHYSSPHILEFNERIWRNGESVDASLLEVTHSRLLGILGQEVSEGLTYFEYTTLLALVVFETCDFMVLEAGLGGEFDATNVCDKILSIVTPIGLDHQAFLGDTIEEIAATKIRSIQKKVLLAPQPYDKVFTVAKKIVDEKEAEMWISTQGLGGEVLKRIAQVKGWPKYLVENAMVALEALELLQIPYRLQHLEDLALFGRFYPLTSHIRIDVGHNPLAARAIVEALEREVVLVYNSLEDKAYDEVLTILKPKIKCVEIIKIETQRAATLEQIVSTLQRLGITYRYFNNEIEETEDYLVFGSFYTVEKFIRMVGEVACSDRK